MTWFLNLDHSLVSQADQFYKTNVARIHLEVQKQFESIFDDSIAPFILNIDSELRRNSISVKIQLLQWLRENGNN